MPEFVRSEVESDKALASHAQSSGEDGRDVDEVKSGGHALNRAQMAERVLISKFN